MAEKKTAKKAAAPQKRVKDSGVAGSFPLDETHYYIPPVVSRRGHHGQDTADHGAIGAIQQELGLPMTGQFDEATAEAVRAWREKNGLAPGNFVDREAWDKMAGA